MHQWNVCCRAGLLCTPLHRRPLFLLPSLHCPLSLPPPIFYVTATLHSHTTPPAIDAGSPHALRRTSAHSRTTTHALAPPPQIYDKDLFMFDRDGSHVSIRRDADLTGAESVTLKVKYHILGQCRPLPHQCQRSLRRHKPAATILAR